MDYIVKSMDLVKGTKVWRDVPSLDVARDIEKYAQLTWSPRTYIYEQDRPPDHERSISELEAVIDRMKCCGNCGNTADNCRKHQDATRVAWCKNWLTNELKEGDEII